MSLPDLPRFYHPNASEQAAFSLDPEEAKHARVVRVQDGDKVHVIDGKGKLYEALARLGKKQVDLHSLKMVAEEAERSNIMIAVAPTKNTNRFEWVIEKAVEMGAGRVIPIIAEHSERTHLRQDRLERIALSAVKQSKALWLPQVDQLTSFTDCLEVDSDERWIAHCHEELERSEIQSLANGPKDASVCVLIGPEGDFSPSEIEAAMRVGWKGLDLGPKRLRTETAAIAAVLIAGLMRR